MRTRLCIALGAVLLAALALLILGGCTASSRYVPTPTPWPTAVVAEKPLYTVATGTVTDSFQLTGQVVPSQSMQLSFAVDGRLAKLTVTSDSSVKEGDILAELDTTDLVEQLSQAQLTLEQAQQQLTQDEAARTYELQRAQLNLQRAQIQLDELRSAAQTREPLERSEAETSLELSHVQVQLAQAAYDRAAAKPGVEASPEAVSLQIATLNYTLAQIRFKLAVASSSDSEIAMQEVAVQLQQLELSQYQTPVTGTLQSKITSAQMEIDSLQRRIEERRIRAPYDGVIVAVGLQALGFSRQAVFTQPKTGDAIAAFTSLIIVAKLEGLEINVPSTASRVNELAIGMPVTVTHPMARNQPFVAEVTAIPVTSADGNPVVGAQVVRISIPENSAPAHSGDYVQVQVVKAVRPNALWIPPAALRQFGDRVFVVVQDGAKQRRVDVVVGLSNDLQVEILSGLSAGEVVVGQ